jgi:lysophospholipase L1-like esterase
VITWILVAALAGFILLLTAELGSRWWMRRHTRYCVWPPGMRLEVRQDAEIFPEVESRVHLDINADGERGAEVRAHADGLFRILAAGGSTVECYALDQPTTWAGMLERLLNRGEALQALRARRVHVGNIGHSGIGAAELDMILERVLPNYERLDAIIVMVSASTVYHWLEDGAPPSREPSVVPELALFAQHPGQTFGWEPRALALTELVRRLRQKWFHPVEVKEHVGAWLVAGRKMRAAAKEIRTSIADPTTVLDHFERHYRQALRHAMAHTRRVLVVRQPWFETNYTAEESARFWHGGIGRPWKEQVSVYFSLDIINRLLGLIDARVVAVAEELGLQHLNLRPLLNQGLQHYYDHDHFTPTGAAIVAHAIAAELTLGRGGETTVRRGTQPAIEQGAA